MDVEELRQRLEHEKESLPLPLSITRQFSIDYAQVDDLLAWQQLASHHHLVCLDDEFYPPLLKQIYDPPVILLVKGNLESLNLPAIAVVGSRAVSQSGQSLTKQIVTDLVSAGLSLTSGMALGVDGIAHRAALDCRGVTVAVLGTGIEEVYPKRHQSLYDEIVERGCVVSEYNPHVKPFAGNFPKRNRIISGLSLGTLVTEARLKSGSLISARMAMEQGREVFAMPGNVMGGQSQGCHELIRNGAKLVEVAADILEELTSLYQFQLEELQTSHHIDKQEMCDLPFASLLASVGYETTPIDQIVEHSGIAINLVLEQLLELELLGWVEAVPGGYIRQKRS